jgi:agmatine deiminase
MILLRIRVIRLIRGCLSMPSQPKQIGYRMPAEWEPHEATWIAWPHNQDDWPGKFAAIPLVYAEIVRHLHLSEEVRILVNSPAAEQRARKVLANLKLDWTRIIFCKVPTDRVWTRDYGPIFVLTHQGVPAILGCRFTGWAKYPDWKRDSLVSHRAWSRAMTLRHSRYEIQELPVYSKSGRLVLEGGAIEGNGAGSVLTTEECLLSKVQCRNPGFTRQDYENVFADSLGVRKVLWLGRGIAGDDTHGHIDDLARFVGPRTVIAVVEDNPRDANYKPLQQNLERLQGMSDQDGQKLEVVKLPMPAPVFWAGRRLPASYANFYIANDRVLVPTFNDPNDRQALGILADLFPGRTVVGIHAVDLVWGMGTIHCLTQQQPAVQK